jgi:dUTP pyrophosphatase
VSTPSVLLNVNYLRDAATIYANGEEHGFAAATAHSAGIDLRACLETPVVPVPAGERVCIPSGVAIEIGQPGVAGFVFSRSGLGAKDGLTVAQGVGVIDPDYRGEIKVWLLNTSSREQVIERGQRIAQLVLLPFFAAEVRICEELGETARGAGGFGHTGKL